MTTAIATVEGKRVGKSVGGRPCTVCNHPRRAEIERESLSTSAEAVARRYAVSQDAVLRHKAKHVPAAMVESEEAVRNERVKEWWTDLKEFLDKARVAAETGENASEVSAALNAASRFMQHKGKALRLLDDPVNIWVAAGYKNEDEAKAEREQRESIAMMTPAEIHAHFMDFERRYALEQPDAARDYMTLLELAGGSVEDRLPVSATDAEAQRVG